MNEIQSTEELRLTARLNKFHNQERDGGASKFDAHNMLEWLRETYMDDLIAYQKSTAIGDIKVLYNRVAKKMDELVHRKNDFVKSKDKAKGMNIHGVASPSTIWKKID
ncbi:MAG: hypothetical protein HKO91_03250 [Desulfobacterales bacterium]|nr:hypothetical protein [Desulfobacterales bacterium]